MANLDWETVAEAAARTGKPISTIHNWIKSGRVPTLMKLPGRTGPFVLDPEAVDLALKDDGR